MPYDRMRQRDACIELEEEFGLTATSAGLGDGRPLSLSTAGQESTRTGMT